MFPEEWRGTENSYFSNDGTEDLTARKEAVEGEFARKKRSLQDIQKISTYDLSGEEYQEHMARVHEAENILQDVRMRRDQILEPFASHYEDALHYERRCAVDAHLRSAIRDEELSLCFETGTPKKMTEWFTQRDRFVISFRYSYIITPKRFGGRCKFPAYFERAPFDTWAAPSEAVLTSYRTDSFEDRLIEWFKEERQRLTTQGIRPKKADMRSRCVVHFSNYMKRDVESKFDHAWALFAHADWLRGGSHANPKKV